MVNQNYRMIRKEQEARVERDRIKIAAAINNGQCVYKDERGYYRWKNPITEKDEPEILEVPLFPVAKIESYFGSSPVTPLFT